MPSISPEIMMYHLEVDPVHRLVKQNNRNFAHVQQKAIAEEVDKHTSARFIREVNYPEWLANVVLVKKAIKKLPSLPD